MSSQTEFQTITVPLSFSAHAIAQTCYANIADPQRAKQVYLNSLAVYAVDYYLQLMDFETDWVNSASRNPSMLQLMDIADLEIKQVGKLECRPVLADAEACSLPPEVWEDRIGYVIVELPPSLTEAKILGFSAIAQPRLLTQQLEPLETLLITLMNLEQATSQSLQAQPINLRDWLQGIVQEGWQRIEDLMEPQPQELALGFRNTMRLSWGQTVDLGLTLVDHPMALVVSIPNHADAEMDIAMQLHPMGQGYLPEGVQLSVSDELGVQFATQSRQADNLIQLKFTAEVGERFTVTVGYGDDRMTQLFST